MMKTFISDLLSRLDTETIIHVKSENEDQVLYSARINGGKWLINDTYYVEEVKPYLRPLSTITDEEEDSLAELDCYRSIHDGKLFLTCGNSQDTICNVIDWLNSHHFDYRNLIEKGLALEAPEGMYTHFGDMRTIVTVEYKGNKL